MDREEVADLYFEWLLDLVCNNRQKKYYSNLLRDLFSREFIFIIRQDMNRSRDGIELRGVFAEENGFNYLEIRDILCGPCTVLEMMVGLAKRAEDSIIGNSKFGDRTGLWFWKMIDSLGLTEMDDGRYFKDFVDDVIENFLDRKYMPNGKGGLFYIPGCREDMRNIEIWYQMCNFLNTIGE